MSEQHINLTLELGYWQAWRANSVIRPSQRGTSTESEGPCEALARLLMLENKAAAPGSDPIQRLRTAVRAIWRCADTAPVDGTFGALIGKAGEWREAISTYGRERTRLHAAAVQYATGTGLHFEQVAALCASYDSGLDVLRKALPE